ncbi:MAG: hypothetical protein HYY26_04005 [Acidobacteria bacterium]|nr:hypothetical protein [Acidobacteriota bacterium]
MRRSVMTGLALAGALLLTLAAPPPGEAKTFTYKVKHQHTFGSCEGELSVTETEVRYETPNREDARIWTYDRIKKVERPGSHRLTVYTYEDQALQFGRDKPFDFEFLDGEVSDDLFAFLVSRLGQREGAQPPAEPPGGRYELAAKHLHTFGGCEGTLKITEESIEYTTDHSKDARLWKYVDIKRFERHTPYRLDIYTYEDQSLQLGRDKIFRFELKEPLEPVVYEFILQRLTRR